MQRRSGMRIGEITGVRAAFAATGPPDGLPNGFTYE